MVPVLKGVVIGSAAALVVGVGLVAAAVAGRAPRPEVPPAAAPGPRMRITLVAPKEPALPPAGGKLETLPPGTPDAAMPPARALAPAPPPVRRGEAVETARDEPRFREPEPRTEDFIAEEEPSFVEQEPGERYSDRRARRRERRDEDRRAERYPLAEPYYAEPPPWWRR